ncbi:MAG: hypothetical protein LBH65_01315 [Desulfovibrio sp.]|jgi:hypothetical protein|nr:hypothetical protein [Desulfovibrio sp.]
MDSALIASTLLLFLISGLFAWFFRARLIPGLVMPFDGLNEAARQALLRRKFRFRTAALGLFVLAALTLFTAFPRGVTLLFVLGGFYCQYRVFRLRRRYPMSVGAGTPPPA